MLRHFITSINYSKLIETQANQVVGHLSKKEAKGVYASPSVINQRKKIIKIGKRR